jgi:1,4-alpha-glucan branching enzyme
MRMIEAETGDVAFEATVDLRPVAGVPVDWGVRLRRGDGSTCWGIFAEVDDRGSTAQHRTFVLGGGQRPPLQEYRLSNHRWMGAIRRAGTGGAPSALRFSRWAPNARAVEVVVGGASGYIADDGHGADPAAAPVRLTRAGDGVWTGEVAEHAGQLGRPYMYRITCDDGQVSWANDMYSRQQAGCGKHDPQGQHYDGVPQDLDGTPSCSVVVDPDQVLVDLEDPAAGTVPVIEFWAEEFNPDRPVPRRFEDLVIYELHIGALGAGREGPGRFADALALLPYLQDLRVNCIELMPLFEFDGNESWGYGSSHFLAVESSAGGREALKYFVRACHRRGIAVLMDVVYNHYSGDSARASWKIDSSADSRNCYYWYEGRESDYPRSEGGYVDNESSGWAPRYHDPAVRDLFVSSAVMLLDEFHVDGLRVDQTTSIHSYNRLHADGRAVGAANVFGRKMLRQLCQTLAALGPDVLLIAEDHSGWNEVTRSAADGGLGFGAAWDVDFYHHLIGDKNEGPEYARLLYTAGRDGQTPLAMSLFARALVATSPRTVVYAESHDEAGNSPGSLRTICTAVNGAPLVGETRRYAEARVRFAFGMTMLSAGVPLFLMGEEVGAAKGYTYDRFAEDKEDLLGLRRGSGGLLFDFYRDIIGLRRSSSALRSGGLEILHVRDPERVIAFRRCDEAEELLVVASLANRPYDNPGYTLRHPALGGPGWTEIFNSDAKQYGGGDIGNGSAPRTAAEGALEVVIPANGFCVLRRGRAH